MALKGWLFSPEEQERFVTYLPNSSRSSYLQFIHRQKVVVFEYIPFPALTGKNDRGLSAFAMCMCVFIYIYSFVCIYNIPFKISAYYTWLRKYAI